MIYYKFFVLFCFLSIALSSQMQIYGSAALGYYYLNVYIGSPPQLQTLILDTGSWMTAFPCNECGGDSCGSHYDNPFNMSVSNTSRKIKCGESFSRFHCNTCGDDGNCIFQIRYSEGSSLQGFYFEDILSFDNNDTTKDDYRFLFGCTTEETNLFKLQYADGILGLGINTNKKYRMPNIIDYYYKKKTSNGLKFSLCLSNTQGGFLSLGTNNFNTHMPEHKTYTVPISRDSGQYNINVYDVKIGNKSLGITHKDFEYEQGTFVDSGTTLFYAHHKIYYAIVEHFGEFCVFSPKCQAALHVTKCYFHDHAKYPNIDDFFDIFPKIEFTLDDNFNFVWEPKDYLYTYGSQKDLYCLPFEKISGRVVFGAITMRNYDIEFDRENKQLHFTKANCSKDWDQNLSPKHLHEKNILQEVSWPRIVDESETINKNASNSTVNLSSDAENDRNTNNKSQLEQRQESDSESEKEHKMILGICVILIVLILVTLAACVAYFRKKRLLEEKSKMIPKNEMGGPPRSDYQKPVENSLPNEKNNNNKGNVYQIEENEDISNTIDMNYEINMDVNNPGMHFSNINFENIDKKKALSQNEPGI